MGKPHTVPICEIERAAPCEEPHYRQITSHSWYRLHMWWSWAVCSVCFPAAAKGSTSAPCLFSGYLKVVFHPQDPSSPPLSWLQLVTVGCGTVPSLGCLVVLCTQGVCWQLWTQLPTGYHLAPRMGDLYPMGFPKGQPTCGGSLHPPALLVSLSCQDGIVLK